MDHSREEWTRRCNATFQRYQSVQASVEQNEEILIVQSFRLAVMKDQDKIRFITGVTNKVQYYIFLSHRDTLSLQIPALPEGSEWIT